MSSTAIRNMMIGFVGLILIIFAFLSWYKYQYSMDIIESYSVNDPSSQHHVLIATQGSPFKNALTEALVNDLKNEDVFLQIVDVTGLSEINESEWAAIVVIHTWEYFKPHPQAKQFANSVKDQSKLIVVTTSGEGKERLKNVDGISSASNMDDVKSLSEKVAKRLKYILN